MLRGSALKGTLPSGIITFSTFVKCDISAWRSRHCMGSSQLCLLSVCILKVVCMFSDFSPRLEATGESAGELLGMGNQKSLEMLL